MNLIRKRCLRRCEQLKNGPQTMEYIYRLMFEPSDIFCPEEVVMTEEGAYVGKRRYRTYAQIHQQTEQAARALFRLTDGVTGKYIGLYAENSPEWIILFWAILRSGNHPFLVNLRQPEETSRQLLKTLGATTLVCLDTAPALTDTTIPFAKLMETDAGDVALPVFGNRLALATSGTTLQQKICIYEGREIAAQLLNTGPIVKANGDIVAIYRGTVRHLAFLPFYHIFGLEAVLLWFSFFGSTFVFPANMMPQTILRTIRDHSVTHIFAVPLLWNAICKGALREAEKSGQQKKLEKALSLSMKLQKLPFGKALAKRLLQDVRNRLLGDSIRFCISGGSYISPATLGFFNAMGYPLYNGFGMSELGITSVELSKKASDRALGSIGKPFVLVQYRIGDNGHLLVKGESTCKQLLINGQPQTMDTWLDTGDLVSADHDGRYYINGRESDLVFGADGENRNPELAERAFQLPQAMEFSVLGDEANENLMLVIRLSDSVTAEQYAAIRQEVARVNSTLAPAYQVKKVRYTTDPLKSEKAIKVSRAWLRRAISEGTVRLLEEITPAAKTQTAEDSPLKAQLRTMIADILDIPPESVIDDAHFMNDLGGSSLDFFALLSEIERTYGIAMEFEPENSGYSLNDFERFLKEQFS